MPGDVAARGKVQAVVVDRGLAGSSSAICPPHVAGESAAGDAAADVFVSIDWPPAPPPWIPGGPLLQNAGAIDGDGRQSATTDWAYPCFGLDETVLLDNVDAFDTDTPLGGFPPGGIYYSIDAATAAMEDGSITEMRAGDVFYVPPDPHDSWVVGDEPYVSLHFLGAGKYAK